jgi:hypothetical protein
MPRSVIELKDLNYAQAETIDFMTRRVTISDEKTASETALILRETSVYGCPEPASVLVSELYRLWAATKQPRTQLVKTSVKGRFHTLSEEITEAEPYLSHSITMNSKVRTAIEEGRTSGLTALLVIALTVGQGYLRKVFLNKNNQFVQDDFDQALCGFWQDNFGFGCEFDFSSADLQNLPFLSNYAPFQWLDLEFLDDVLESPMYASNDPVLEKQKRDKKFLAEKYQTLLWIILTPFSVISEMANDLIEDLQLKTFVLDLLKPRLFKLETAALLMDGFRKYIFEQAPDCINKLSTNLTYFPDINPDAFKMQMQLKFNLIKCQAHLEVYVTNHQEFSTRYKRYLLMSMVESMLRKAKTFEEVMSFIIKIRDSSPYLILKQRQGFFRASVMGTHHDGVAVSDSYDFLLHLAKARMIQIAKNKACLERDKSLLQTLSRRDNPYGKFIHMQRYRFFAKETESARAVRELLQVDFNADNGAVEMVGFPAREIQAPQLAARIPLR